MRSQNAPREKNHTQHAEHVVSSSPHLCPNQGLKQSICIDQTGSHTLQFIGCSLGGGTQLVVGSLHWFIDKGSPLPSGHQCQSVTQTICLHSPLAVLQGSLFSFFCSYQMCTNQWSDLMQIVNLRILFLEKLLKSICFNKGQGQSDTLILYR